MSQRKVFMSSGKWSKQKTAWRRNQHELVPRGFPHALPSVSRTFFFRISAVFGVFSTHLGRCDRRTWGRWIWPLGSSSPPYSFSTLHSNSRHFPHALWQACRRWCHPKPRLWKPPEVSCSISNAEATLYTQNADFRSELTPRDVPTENLLKSSRPRCPKSFWCRSRWGPRLCPPATLRCQASASLLSNACSVAVGTHPNWSCSLTGL